MKKRTRVYIDGNNLYYGLLKDTPWKWLDLPAFVAELVGPDHEIVAVNYFTAPIKTYPYDPAAIERQNVYIQALSTVLVFNPHVGLSDHLKRAASYYKNIPRDLPSRFQLPDSIPVGEKGNFICRPAAWK